MLLISEALRDALVNYLATRPYAEVAQAVPALQSLPVAPTEDAKK